MKNISSFNRWLFAILFVVFSAQCTMAIKRGISNSEIKKKYRETIDALQDVEVIGTLTSINEYTNILELRITQPVDHLNPSGATFTQRVYISHIDFSKPMVMITEGYTAPRNYTSELASLLNSNQIVVEHRYFGESCPEPLKWKFMNVRQAAADHHKIIQIFKELYTGKWLTSGISKGGQTSIFHRKFYPNDVDVTVPYVAPLVFLREDPRVYTFLENVGTAQCRQKIKDFQIELLKNKADYMPIFEEKAQQNNITFNKLGLDAAYEYCVFEYEFAFWQWGRDCNNIPIATNGDKKMVNELFSASADFFSDQEIERNKAFFYQALTELGFYGYSITEFSDWVETVKTPDFFFYAPPGEPLNYNPYVMQEIYYWLQDYGNNMLYIYGEVDAWSACAVPITGRTNAVKMIKKGGSHTTRIKSFEGQELEKIHQTLEKWLDISID